MQNSQGFGQEKTALASIPVNSFGKGAFISTGYRDFGDRTAGSTWPVGGGQVGPGTDLHVKMANSRPRPLYGIFQPSGGRREIRASYGKEASSDYQLNS
jgi:hypothetical protein